MANQRKNHGGPPSASPVPSPPGTPPVRTPPSASIATQTTAWQGPLPSPADLASFDQTIPGGAARILKMAEDEQAHRIAFETQALAATIRDKRRGQYMGSIVGFVAVVGAIATALYGVHWSVPIALVGVPVLGIVQALVSGRPEDRSGK